jgi:uncharacterized protein (DUF2249 family)
MIIIRSSVLMFFVSVQLFAQQVPDTLFSHSIINPIYSSGKGPTIFIDGAHNNFHTLSGGFKPFGKLLRNDGYVVKSSTEMFTAESLTPAKIVVIANAVHSNNTQRWSLPTPSAFTDDEISAINLWVKHGGSLFMIADHMPFPGAAEKLAASFGIKFYNGFAMNETNNGKDIFKVGSGLTECSLTKGRNDEELVTSVQTFTGQAFQIPEEATAIITLDDRYEVLLPETAWEFTKGTPRLPAAGFVQGTYMVYGQGRLVVFGEAAMFTAQVHGKSKFGMNSRSASQNAQFLLNTIHWLDGLFE